MPNIVGGYLFFITTLINANGGHAVFGIIPQPVGWEYMARGHFVNIAFFYGIIVVMEKKLFFKEYLLTFVGLSLCLMLFFNKFGYYIQQAIQCCLLIIVGYMSYRLYHKINKYSFQLKIIFAIMSCYHIVSAGLHCFLMIFFTPAAHNSPLVTLLQGYVGLWWLCPFVLTMLYSAYMIYSLSRHKAMNKFNPGQSYIIHFLPMRDGIRTWAAFLYPYQRFIKSLSPFPHYAVYDFHQTRKEWGLWKFSKKGNGLVFHPISSGKLDRLFKRGLVLICEPVQIVNRLESLEGKVKYSLLAGDHCHRLVLYVKGETDDFPHDLYFTVINN